MSRLNNILQQKEEAAAKKGQIKKKQVIPVYDMAGKTITPEKKKREVRVAVVLLVLAALFACIYLPGLFMKDTTTATKNASITVDSTAIRKNNTVLRNNAAEDFDGDGLSNSEEATLSTSPWKIDTDDDGATDYCEVNVTSTDPKTADSIMVDAQTKLDKTNGKNVGSPYKIGNVILWANDYTSKSYGSVVETLTGYHFCYFDGYAQFPEESGKYAYKMENGVRTLLPHREAENAWRVSAGDFVELYKEPLEEIIEFDFFNHAVYVPSNTATDILAAILPDKGLVTATKKMKIDIEPDTRDSKITEIVKPSFDSNDEYRFTINNNTLNDLLFVRESIDENCCIAVSLYNEQVGEYLAIIYGYTYDGDLLLADMNSLEPVGTLNITECARKIMDKNGDIVSTSYFEFDGFGYDSRNGDRISYFAASSKTTNTESQFGKNAPDDSKKAEDSTKEKSSNETEEKSNNKTEGKNNDTEVSPEDNAKEPDKVVKPDGATATPIETPADTNK